MESYPVSTVHPGRPTRRTPLLRRLSVHPVLYQSLLRTGPGSTAKKRALFEYLSDYSCRLIALGLVGALFCGGPAITKAVASTDANADRTQRTDISRDHLRALRVRASERETYLVALQEARSGKSSAVKAAVDSLGSYPLTPYLLYEMLIARPRSSDQDVLSFIETYPELPITPFLRRQFASFRMKQRDQDSFLKIHRPNEGNSEIQCFRARALWQTGNTEAAMAATEALWLTARSQHSSCDSAFANWRKRSGLTPQLTWQRFELAVLAGERRLANYLKRFMDGEQETRANQLMRLVRSPSRLAKTSSLDLMDPELRQLGVEVIKRLIRSDPEAGATVLASYQPDLTIPAAELEQLQYQLARTVIVDEHDWTLLDAIPSSVKTNAELLEMRIRRSLREKDWQAAASVIADLPDTLADKPVWRYWRAKLALEGHADNATPTMAHRALQDLATEREYYGYLAAYLLGSPPKLNDRPLSREQSSVLNLRAAPAAQRIEELLALNQITEARREWFTLTRGFSMTELLVAAQLASDWQWPDIAIATIAQAKYWDDLSIRFPVHFRYQLAQAARRESLPESLLFAIARRESGFWPEARSRVGAAGLMQVMPKTAEYVNQQAGERLSLPSPLVIDDPDHNIALGAAYFNGLMNDHQQNRILSLAAYNAGPSRVQRWAKRRLPLDAWVESIPFAETRAYVQTVLMYAYVYGKRFNEPIEFLYDIDFEAFDPIAEQSMLNELRGKLALPESAAN